jgi:hypothetical protein
MVKKKTLWLKNNTGSDVSLSDLGVKVAANQTINVYAYNPYVTVEQVKKSMEDGAISKRLENNVLSVVKGTKKSRPHTLDHIKASSDAVEIVKSKTSVFINTKDEDVLNDEDLGDIADYGLGELGHNNTTNMRTDDGSVVVKQKEDELVDEISDATVYMEKVEDSGVSGQSIVAMTKQVESQSNPVGPMANDSSPADQPFVVVDPPKDPEPQQTTAIDEAEKKLYEMNKAKKRIKQVGESVVIDGKETDKRNLKEIASGEPDFHSIIKDEAGVGVQVATKDESGAIIMTVMKETVEEKPEPEIKKPKVVKAAKKRAKKKTSKKKGK